ncbi:Protein of unknown function [Pseudomonas sp. ok272]|uniref:DUF3613 domain-containing protein n=1 Tax=unclassified Pseudomonas TaxID=196821 RepID=UPI0008B4A61D|nr:MULTISPECIES: DUF3613 domain-containing protein [unclassified Pseudomonas]SEM89479.1 Protein of unknown function [Pseudomonas sp. ok272]SFM73789.1 Protein of unknown function [Pseudomonas sp. ok602]
MTKLHILGCLGLLSLPLSAMAIDAGPSSAQQQETEGWLVLQSRNQVASPIPQDATATEREQAMKRWLKSFSHDIPDFFEQGKEGHLQSGSGGS